VNCTQLDSVQAAAGLRLVPGGGRSVRTLAVNWTVLKSSIEAHLDRVRADLDTLESGDSRRGARDGNGPWRDTTDAVIHEARNLMATLEALLQIVSYLEITQRT